MNTEDIGKEGNMKKKQGKRKIDGVVEERVERGRVAELIETSLWRGPKNRPCEKKPKSRGREERWESWPKNRRW